MGELNFVDLPFGKVALKKKDFFAWAREWNFASTNATKPIDYERAVKYHIQDMAKTGLAPVFVLFCSFLIGNCRFLSRDAPILKA